MKIKVHQGLITYFCSGDDCVSVQTGCSNVYIHNINCGPGHGISIGSLGKDNTRACVSNITVRDVKIQDSLTGVRIKTWQVQCHLTKVFDCCIFLPYFIIFFFSFDRRVGQARCKMSCSQTFKFLR